MEFFHWGFLHFRWVDLIDVFIMTWLLYKLYFILRGSSAANILFGIIFIYACWILFAKVLDMQLLGSVLGQFISVGVIIIIIVFQQEVRKFLIMVGQKSVFFGEYRIFRIFGFSPAETNEQVKDTVREIVNACAHMAKNRTGAIIAITRQTTLEVYINTGDRMDAIVSKRLLESIFSKSSPLHDGGVLVSGNRIIAAGCVLPLSSRHDLPAYMGMRHRAAVGLSDESDALVLVVSEQTGTISLIVNGQFYTNMNAEDIERKLIEELG